MRGSFTLIIGAAMTLCFAIASLVSFIWVPFDVTLVDIPNKLQRSNGQHWLGTDHFGRDLLSMIMVGARTSIAVALIAVGIGILIGVPLGLLAAARKNSSRTAFAAQGRPATSVPTGGGRRRRAGTRT